MACKKSFVEHAAQCFALGSMLNKRFFTIGELLAKEEWLGCGIRATLLLLL
jgi:hypothetical protein